GRTQYDSPEVDQEVLIEATEELEDVLEEGCFHMVEIIGVEGYDLYGKVVNGPVSE
ncbi:MAG: hypothetical protein J6K90_02045, partial [Tidjanibacter sp.]|nr:hypothetical protein [Tidjanibacter sp.]